jgi:hypothetical protein
VHLPTPHVVGVEVAGIIPALEKVLHHHELKGVGGVCSAVGRHRGSPPYRPPRDPVREHRRRAQVGRRRRRRGAATGWSEIPEVCCVQERHERPAPFVVRGVLQVLAVLLVFALQEAIPVAVVSCQTDVAPLVAADAYVLLLVGGLYVTGIRAELTGNVITTRVLVNVSVALWAGFRHLLDLLL